MGACTAVYSGVYFEILPKAISIPLTIVWIVGITNAFNLIDNMDGLCAGIAVISGAKFSSVCTTSSCGIQRGKVLFLRGSALVYLYGILTAGARVIEVKGP